MRNVSPLHLCLFALLAAYPAFAPAAAEPVPPPVTLHVGDPAPKLFVSKWVKGGPVGELEKGKVYVIECWATWCGPCIATIPHVTALQAKYKDKGLVVVGMNVWEPEPAAAEPFVQKMGDKMGYAVALDVPPPAGATSGPGDEMPTGKTAAAWLAAAGQTTIPCSFIVDRQGKLAWFGLPVLMERPLSQVLAGTFDPKQEEAFVKKTQDLEQQTNAALGAKDYDKALSLRDQLAAMDPFMAGYHELTKVPLYLKKGDYPAANALAAKLADGPFKDDARSQTQIAFSLVNAADPSKIDADLALRLAERVYAAVPTDLTVQKVTAQAYALKKQYAKAAEVQAKLVERLNGTLREREKRVLEEYKTAGGKS